MPTHQEELFPLPSGFHPNPEQTEPLLWVRELRIYRVVSPVETNLLRRIALHPGLNILWAKPRDRTSPMQRRAPGVSGHATGKTTFCRFLRYLLGESAFGNDEQRARLRDVFPDGAVVGEVHLAGTPWLICRPFRVGGSPHLAYRNRTIESLFSESDEGRTTFEDYRQELTRLLAEPLPVATFATTPAAIEWPHVIQWVARDQECRFAGLAELRHSSSDSQSPNMVTEDIHFLFRAALGLIDTTEQQELETNKELLKRKQDAERDAPLFRFRGDSAHDRLRKRLPDFRTDVTGADFLDAVTKEWASRTKASETELQTMKEPGAVKAAQEGFLDARDSFRRAEHRQKEISAGVELIDQQVKQLRGDISKDQLDTWLKANVPSERECGHSLAEAIEWECPLAVGRKLPIENKAQEIPMAEIIEQLEQRRAKEVARLDQAKAQVSRCELLLSTATVTLRRETEVYDRVRGELARQRAEDLALAVEAKRAYDDKTEADRLDGSIKDLEKDIRKSQDRQAAIRDQKNAALSNFSQTFGRVARAIVDEEVQGSIRFNGRKVRPTLIHEIDLTSAALETLKIICFDLAAMISGIEGRGNHPRFLIHDGPREADMDSELYQRIFYLARALEESFEGRPMTFQYIITTTEPPPAEMQSIPWLLTPTLDASTREGKLLGAHF